MSAPHPAPPPRGAAPPARPGRGEPAPQPVVEEGVSGARSLVRALEEVGAEVAFGIPGGAVLPLYDPLFDSTRLRHVLVRHEQGAGHAATGYAQATGKVGLCIATSGPGATNLVTPIADAYMDSVPLVAVTGQVPSGAIGTDAFQEADISGITLPITKHSYLVQDAAGHPARGHRGLPPGLHGPSGAGAGGRAQGRAAGEPPPSGGRSRSTCRGTAPPPGRTPSRCAPRPSASSAPRGRCSTWAAAC